jgi:hypothetical protein
MTPIEYDILKTLLILGNARPGEQFLIREIMHLSGLNVWGEARRFAMQSLVEGKYVHQLSRWGTKAYFYEISDAGRLFLNSKSTSVRFISTSVGIA